MTFKPRRHEEHEVSRRSFSIWKWSVFVLFVASVVNKYARWNPCLLNTSASRTPLRSTSICSIRDTTACEGACPQARRGHRHRQGVGPARPRRRRVSHRNEVAVRRQEIAEPEVHRLQRRRERARNLQGSPAHGAQPSFADRRVRHCLLRHRRQDCLHLHPRASFCTSSTCSSARSRKRTPTDSSERTCLAPVSSAMSTSIAVPARTRREKRRRCSSRSKASGRSRATSRRFQRSSGSTTVRPPSITSRPSANVPLILLQRRRVVRRTRSGEERRAQAVLRQRTRQTARSL